MKKTHNPYYPDVIVCMGYDSFYDDYDKVDVHEILKGIPSVVALRFVAENLEKVLYSQSDTRNHIQLIREYCQYVPKEIKEKIWKYLRTTPDCELYETYGCSLLYGLILQNFTPYDEGDDYAELCKDEYEKLFKALTYCNKRWTDEQEIGAKMPNVVDMSIRIDMPVVEFKRYKNFMYQIYKTIPFFEFLESDTYYNTQVLPAFYADHRVTHWREYIARIMNLYSQSLKTCILDVSVGTNEDFYFFEQYAANPNDAECANLWEGHNAISYLRNHFLYPIGEKKFLLLNANFLIDKIYQGVKFDLFSSISRHGLKRRDGEDYDGLPNFSSIIGEEFSESHLLYAYMQKTFSGKYSALYTGEELKAKHVPAEPDLYMRVGKSLFLFEFKDLSLGDTIRYSTDINKIKDGIKDRICLYTDRKRKGAGQLHKTIENIVNHSMDVIDPDVRHVETIYPIVVVTDRAFSAIGVQNFVVAESNKFPTIDFNGLITIPIVVDFDALINLSYRFHEGKLQIEEVIKDYLLSGRARLTPFMAYVEDTYWRGKKGMSEAEIKFLYGDMIK